MTYQLQNDYVSYWNTSLTQIEEEQLTEDITIIQGQITTIQGQITTIQGQITTLQGDVSTLQGQVATLQSQVSTLQSQVSTLQSQVSTLQGDVSTLQGQVSTLQGQVSAIQAELLALHTYFYSFSIVSSNLRVNTSNTDGYEVNVVGDINVSEYYKNGNIYSLNPDDLYIDYPVGLSLCDYHGNTFNNDANWKKCGQVVNRSDYKQLANELGIPVSMTTFTLPCPRLENDWIQNRPWNINGNNISYNGNGNVGIGTTLPTTKLDVNGEMKANRVIGVDYNDVTNKPVIVSFDFWSDSPVGVIMIWSQTTLPSVKWAWCDGLNGTIDLTGRVPIGATKYSGFDDPLSPNYQRWFNNPNDKIGSGSSYLSDVNIPTHKVYTSGSTANYTHHHQYQKQNYLNRLVAGGAIDAGDPTTTTATNTTSDTHNHTVALYSSGRIYRSSDNTLLTDTNELPVPISLYQPSTYVLFIQKIIP